MSLNRSIQANGKKEIIMQLDASTATPGDIIGWKGQRYIVIGTAENGWLEFHSNCADCGAPFKSKCPPVIESIKRRCGHCAKSGIAVNNSCYMERQS